MFWPVLIGCSPALNTKPSSKGVADTPYVFSIELERRNDEDYRLEEIPYDFEIEGVNKSHIFQIGFVSGRLAAIDGLIVRKERCVVYESPYTDLETILNKMPAFGLMPLSSGAAPNYGQSAVIQKAETMLHLYSDAVVITFDEFHGTAVLGIADCVDAAIAANGCLAALIFRERLADYLTRKVMGE